MRILFVGGEDSLPPDLIDLVGGMDESWDVQCVGDGATATSLAADLPQDIVVVAPVLPDMPAATLLGQIRTLRPETSRIALVGDRDPPPARVLSLAHRFLPLPLAPVIIPSPRSMWRTRVPRGIVRPRLAGALWGRGRGAGPEPKGTRLVE